MKFCFGPMSLNIIDTIIKFADNQDCIIGLIPSRRQIDWNGGYVGNFTSKSFCHYVRTKSNNIILERDHAGPLQGQKEDDGLASIYHDVFNFDIVHLDPFKKMPNLIDASNYTIDIIRYGLKLNSKIKFEVGTEEAIYPYSSDQLHNFLRKLEQELGNQFRNIEYVVIQTGCKINGLDNQDNLDYDIANEMIRVCKQFGLKSKEHNGDFIKLSSLYDRFKLGVDCINIAPELGIYETRIILQCSKNEDELIKLCVASNAWKKWLPDSATDYQKALFSGHYLFSNLKFKELKYQILHIDQIICKQLYKFLMGLYNPI